MKNQDFHLFEITYNPVCLNHPWPLLEKRRGAGYFEKIRFIEYQPRKHRIHRKLFKKVYGVRSSPTFQGGGAEGVCSGGGGYYYALPPSLAKALLLRFTRIGLIKFSGCTVQATAVTLKEKF
jgi:hypothetical protein